MAARGSIALLDRPDRRRYRLAVIAQMATSLLDLLGVLLIGLVGLLAATIAQEGSTPPAVQQALDAVGLGSLSVLDVAGLAAIAAVVLLVMKSVLYATFLKRMYRFLARCQRVLVSRMTRQLMAQSILRTAGRSSQEVSYAIITGTFFTITALLAGVSIILSELAVLVLIGTALLFIDPVMTLATLAFFAILGVVMQRFLGRAASVNGSRRAEGSVEGQELLQEALAAHREIFALHRRGRYAGRINTVTSALSTAAAQTQFINEMPKLIYEAALVVGVLMLAVWQFATQELVPAVASLTVFLAAGFRILPTMVRLNSQMISVRGLGALVHPTVVLARELAAGEDSLIAADEVDTPWRRDASGFVPGLVIDSVTFTYPGREDPAVRDISLRIRAGQSLALVGRSGSGKSTLADLVLGIIEPEHGVVTIGGLSPADAITTWPGAIAYVPQAVMTFNSTVRDNVLMGLSTDEVTEDEVWEALASASLADLFRAEPEGLETMVGERGIRLSGGQRQRLGLARALLTRPRLLVLDEATSALDAETEDEITRAVARLSGSVTTVTIAHRLTTIQHADVVAYLEDGACVAWGTFDEIRRANESFERQADLLGLRP
ncbi:MAG: ABC transporter ATP-binding protein [Candidatus Nanopelagicales bacterium]